MCGMSILLLTVARLCPSDGTKIHHKLWLFYSTSTTFTGTAHSHLAPYSCYNVPNKVFFHAQQLEKKYSSLHVNQRVSLLVVESSRCGCPGVVLTLSQFKNSAPVSKKRNTLLYFLRCLALFFSSPTRHFDDNTGSPSLAQHWETGMWGKVR